MACKLLVALTFGKHSAAHQQTIHPQPQLSQLTVLSDWRLQQSQAKRSHQDVLVGCHWLHLTPQQQQQQQQQHWHWAALFSPDTATSSSLHTWGPHVTSLMLMMLHLAGTDAGLGHLFVAVVHPGAWLQQGHHDSETSWPPLAHTRVVRFRARTGICQVWKRSRFVKNVQRGWCAASVVHMVIGGRHAQGPTPTPLPP